MISLNQYTVNITINCYADFTTLMLIKTFCKIQYFYRFLLAHMDSAEFEKCSENPLLPGNSKWKLDRHTATLVSRGTENEHTIQKNNFGTGPISDNT